DWTTFIDRIAEHVDHAADECLADRHFHNASGSFYEIAFANGLKLTKQHRTDFVFFEVQREATNVVWKLEQLAGHYLFQAVQLGDSVTDLDYGSDFGNRHSGFEVLDLFAINLVN